MVIAIDGYEANVGERVGIGRYALEILERIYTLVTNNSELKQHSFRIYLPSPPLSDMPKETPWWKYRLAKPKKMWTFLGLPLALYKDFPKADVVFSPTHYLPRFVSIPRVMAIMDLSYLKYPQMFRPRDLYQLTTWTAYSVKHSARILTISQFTKDAIIKAYRVPPERVVVTYPGITMPISNIKYQIANIQSKYNIGKNYILSVGTIQPRKNYVRLIEAFSQACNLLISQYPDLSLIIVGKKGWLWKETLEAPKRFGVEKQVKFLDFVPDDDLPVLYQQALCFALPSLYEGFGLPVVEAMAQKCSVVVSKTSSLPEIAGPSGIYVDPEDVASITQGLKQALVEHGTTKERQRVGGGLAHIKKFSWDKAAKQTLEVLTKVGAT